MLAVVIGAPSIVSGLQQVDRAAFEVSRHAAVAMVYSWDASIAAGYGPEGRLGPFTPLSQEDIDTVLERPIPEDDAARADRIAADGVAASLAADTASMYDSRAYAGYGLAGFGLVFILSALMQQTSRRGRESWRDS
ncbi:hypothetical protein GCM10022399_44440 [Terrabacter ginsenosidimutans]|uniref:Uncharacterized protein n=1 Tax=Terrabacter ginsenosidimutans TaxID=490575 RepID=A0ABP7ER87_9MICO